MAMHPGNFVKVEMVPDFGWLGALAGPLIPKAYGWFDPADRFNYVGGLFESVLPSSQSADGMYTAVRRHREVETIKPGPCTGEIRSGLNRRGQAACPG